MLLFATNYPWKGCVGYLVLSWNLPNLYLPGNLLPSHLIPEIPHLVCLFAKFQFMLMIHEHQGQTFARHLPSLKEMQLTGVLGFLPWGSLILTWFLRCGRLYKSSLYIIMLQLYSDLCLCQKYVPHEWKLEMNLKDHSESP